MVLLPRSTHSLHTHPIAQRHTGPADKVAGVDAADGHESGDGLLGAERPRHPHTIHS